MPLYDYQCQKCGEISNCYRSIAERYDAPECCGVKSEKLILPIFVRGDLPEYRSPIDGMIVRGYKQRIDDLKKHHCRPWEGLDAEKQHAESCRRSEEAATEKRIAEGAAQVLNHLSAASQRALKGF